MNNPIFKKEQTIRTRSPKLMILLVAFNIGLLLLMILSFLTIYGVKRTGSLARYEDTLFLYILIGIFEFALMLLIVPTFTAGSITGEKERQTFDTLITTNRRPSTIVMGKLGASVSMMVLLIVSSLPILATVFSAGGVSLIDIIRYVVTFLLESIFIGSIGMICSVSCKSTTKSTVLAYINVLLLVLGTIAILGALYIFIGKQINTEMNDYNAVKEVVDLKYGVCLLLLNPLVTIVALLFKQTGNVGVFNDYLSKVGSCNSFILENWVEISIFLQLSVAVILLFLCIKKINQVPKS